MLDKWQKDTISRHLDEIVEEIVKFKYKEDEKLMFQEVVRLQKERIDELEKNNKEGLLKDDNK